MLLDDLVQTPVVVPATEGGGESQAPTEVPVAETEPVTSEVPTTPAIEPAPVTPVEEPVVIPALPGEVTSEAEMNWLRQTVAQLSQHLQAARQQQAEWESANLTVEQRQERAVQQQQQQLLEQQQALQAQQAQAQWKSYYEQWVPKEKIAGADPIQWQHAALTHLYTERARLQKENDALRKAVAKPAPNPTKVTSAGPGPTHTKTLSTMTLAEMERLKENALWGNISASDYPAI